MRSLWCFGVLPLCAVFFGTAFAHAQTLHLEAEKAQLVGPSIRISPAAEDTVQPAALNGYSGTGFVTGFQQPADHLVFHFKIKQAGIYTVSIAYRAHSRRGYDLSVNGEGVSGMFQPSPGTGFSLMSVGQVDLPAGDNEISVNRGWGYFDLDYLELRPAPPPTSPPPVTTPPPTSPPPVTTPPVDPAITPEARALLSRLDASYGKSTALGVYTDEDAAYVLANTGLRPAIMGGDLLWYTPFFRAHQPLKDDEIDRLIADYKAGYTLTVCWHWGSPTGAVDTKEKPWWRAFYTDSTTFDVTRAVDPSTPEHTAALADIDAIAVQLRHLQDAHIPVLWRPLHEGQGGWFWWGAKGPEAYKQMWAMVYDRLVNVDGLHNLLWVFVAADDPAWYPGDASVDVVGIDEYPKDMHDTESSLWDNLQKQFAGRKPIAINEFGGVPDIPRMQHFGEYWAYAITWSNKYGTYGPQKNTPAELKRIYTSPGVATLPATVSAPPARAPDAVPAVPGVIPPPPSTASPPHPGSPPSPTAR